MVDRPPLRILGCSYASSPRAVAAAIAVGVVTAACGSAPEGSGDPGQLGPSSGTNVDGDAAAGSEAGESSSNRDSGASSGMAGPSTAEGGASGSPEGGPSAILAPAQGALLGHFYGNGTVAQTDAMIGQKPRIHLSYYDWVTDWTKDSAIADDFSSGKIPLVNWEPFDASGNMISFDDLVSGMYDAEIDMRATGAAALGKKFFLDFAAEMNGDEAWSGHDPASYVIAWRHVHDRFVAAGATNVVWAWCPNVTDSDNTNNMTMAYYPGDAYVDWTGVDGYNWGTSDPNFTWQSFQNVFQNIYPLLAKVGKPILIGEMASDEVGGSKSQWITDIVPTLKADFPMIKAFVWFDIKKERSWQINSSSSSLAAYQKMAVDPYMNP